MTTTEQVLPSPHEVKEFYNEFLTSRMVDYRLHPNPRIEAAIARIAGYVSPQSQIIDIGCGIGIVAEAIGRLAIHGHVWACDLSDRNVWYAQTTVNQPNVAFKQIDVLSQFKALEEWVDQSVDVITLVDVIEHIPSADLKQLFQNLAGLLSPNGVLILTFPSPDYLEHLHKNDPNELQIVDEMISLATIVDIASNNGLHIKHYSLCDIWYTNQYVHCVLSKSSAIVRTTPSPRNLVSRLTRSIQYRIDRHFFLPRRRKKYLQTPFSPLIQ